MDSNVVSIAERAKRKGSETVQVKLSDLLPLCAELIDLRRDYDELSKTNAQLTKSLRQLLTRLTALERGN